jgi:diguanylate cyclase
MDIAVRTAPRSLRQLKLWQLYLMGGFILTALYVFVPPFKASAPLINLLGLSGVIAVIVGVQRNRPRARLAWWLCALGLFLFWLGDVYT